MVNNVPRIIYAGDRDIAVWVLKFIIDSGVRPLALLLPDENKATYSKELIDLCSHLDASKILKGEQFKNKQGINLIKEIKPDFIICVHFPHIIPKEILKIPKQGVINLHPAYLPYNRGWHTATWAILDETPYGATLHFMDENIDTGDIIHQKKISILPSDTADTLYKRVKKLEYEVFKEAWPLLLTGKYKRIPQPKIGSFHKKSNILSLQRISPNQYIKAEELIKKLRALTTNNIKEGAYFELNGKKYRIQIKIVEDD